MSAAGLLTGYGRAFQRLLGEIQGEDAVRPIVLVGDAGACGRIRRALGVEEAAGSVRVRADAPVGVADLTGAALLLVALERGVVTGQHETALRLADRQRLPIVAVLLDVPADERVDAPPYVLETAVLRVPAGAPLPLEPLLERVARAAVPGAWALGRAIPALRGPICHALTGHYSTLNAGVGAAVFVPGADLPVLTLNQLRLAARIAAVHGVKLDRSRLAELAAVVGAGFGLRTAARQLLGVVPGPGWALKGAIAYGGTRAIGEAVARWAETRTPRATGGDG